MNMENIHHEILLRINYATIESMKRVISVLGEIHEIPSETISCMQGHVENGTYKFANELKNPTETKWDD